jgi:hypothetical protein
MTLVIPLGSHTPSGSGARRAHRSSVREDGGRRRRPAVYPILDGRPAARDAASLRRRHPSVPAAADAALLAPDAVDPEHDSARVDGTRTRSGAIGTAGLADAHRAHLRLVKLVASGDDVEAEKLWRRHLEAATEELARHPRAARTVIDLLP